MDRGKGTTGKRPLKTKGHPPPGDFIALGSKSKSGNDVETRSSSSPQPMGRKIPSAVDRKREASAPAAPSLVTKKPKLMGQMFTPLGRPEVERRGSPALQSSGGNQFEDAAIDVDPRYLVDEVLAGDESSDDDRVDGLLCGAMKLLRSNRAKPDQLAYLSLMYLAKQKPSLFGSEVVIEAFCSILKRDMSLNFKAKGNAVVSVCACNVLMTGYAEEENWPDDFVKVYIEDALGERVWVDREDCRYFVENIQTAFGTKVPHKNSLITFMDVAKSSDQSGASSPMISVFEDDDKSMDAISDKSSTSEAEVYNTFKRYPCQMDYIESYVMDILRDQVNRRQAMDIATKNMVRLMTATCGYGEVRAIAAQKLEMWLQNPKMSRPAQDLLLSVCLNCHNRDSSDLEVITQIIKIRLKTKPLISHYVSCIRELLGQNQDNIRLILNHTIYNELSNSRNPNNMALLSVIFQHSSEVAAKILAEIFQDLLCNKDDYIRALRALLREIVRSLRYDINLAEFSLRLMQERTGAKFNELDATRRERYLMSITDLIALSILAGINPSVKDAAAALARGERKDIEALHKYQSQIAIIQRDAVWWLHTVLPKFQELKPAEYMHCLHKVLFMESAEHYYNKDNWPSEGDRVVMLQMASEVPVLEETLMRILLIGLSKDLPLSSADAIELTDQLIRRAAVLYADGCDVLHVERLELIDAILNLCSYKHPDNIVLPKGYLPPTLAITNLYWKSWTMLLLISAFNPSTFGLTAWENYPTLKCMIEMVMTNTYSYPPPTTATEEKMIDEIRLREQQASQKEKEEILEFESHLAAATSKVTITESSSLLLAQLASMDPSGPARKPPPYILDQLKQLNQSLKIGQMFCRSRNPDFLLDIIQRQGTSQSMPWLAELVESSEGSLDMLPVQCLCEFLLHDASDNNTDIDSEEDSSKVQKQKKKQKKKKKILLLGKLQDLVHSEDSDNQKMFKVLDYFFKRLSSHQPTARALAIKGLSMVMSRSQMDDPGEEMEEGDDSIALFSEHKWLLCQLPSLPLFDEVKSSTCLALRQACKVETTPLLVSSYIVFLSKFAIEQNLFELDEQALDIAQLIVERTTVINYILPQEGVDNSAAVATLHALLALYTSYLCKAKEPDKEAYDWANTQDQIILQWDNGDSATMHVLVVHAMIIMLTYGTLQGISVYDTLLETWFPEKGHSPSAFLLDTSEEALLLPDWLKLRMIRSCVQRLVDAALQDLEPGQLLLFVQSFGIPIPSMSKLLQCLDNAVDIDFSGLEQAVVDKPYMAQLIEIQHMRGAKGGECFYRMLTQREIDVTASDDDSSVVMGDDARFWSDSSQQKKILTVSKDQLQALIVQAFDLSKMSAATEAYGKLLKSLSSDSSMVSKVTECFQHMMCSSTGTEFTSNLTKQPHRICPVIRLLMSKSKIVSRSLRVVLEKLSQFCGGQRSPLSAMINSFMSSQNGGQLSVIKADVKAIIENMKTNGQVDESKFLEGFRCLEERGDSRLQALVESTMKGSIATKTIAAGVGTACHALIDAERRKSIPVSAACLFVDWLELLDPEVISCLPELQQLLLFAKERSAHVDRDGKRAKQPYLLALLTHQSSWATLHRCIHRLLREADVDRYDSTIVLDFLWACFQIPKIWQGKEMKMSKSNHPDVLGLTDTHILTVVDYIIREPGAIQSHDSQIVTEAAACIDDRVELLMACIGEDDKKLKCVVNFVEQRMHKSSASSCLYHHLLLEMYLQKPYLLSWIHNITDLMTESQSSQRSISQLDAISHRLINSFGEVSSGKAAERKMYDANIACRKLAAEHPLLLLRQLPMLAALMRGKTAFTFSEMKHRNYLMLFTHVLNLLFLLQPHVFKKEYPAVQDILEEFFKLIETHGQVKQLVPLIVKLLQFLHIYISSCPQQSSVQLHKHLELFSDLSHAYPDMGPLKSLLAGLSLPRHMGTEVIPNQGDGGAPSLLPARPSSPWTNLQLGPFLNKIKKGSPLEDVMDVLIDLDEASKRKVNILEHFQTDLKRLMSSQNDKCRNTAFMLVMRHIRQNPQSASEFVPVFLHCLGSDNPDIANTTLTNMAEFVILSQGQAKVILQRAFTVGITSTLETSSYINETIQLLNLENMNQADKF